MNRGEWYGIVGKSGAGKTTIINLILGLIEPSKGEIYIDNIKLRNIKITDWREQIGFVSQNMFFLDDSLRSNIAFGEDIKNIDEKKLKSAIKKAHLDELIKRLPKKIMTEMGERSSRLSGGQSQRVP